MDPRIRIHTKMSWIRNTDYKSTNFYLGEITNFVSCSNIIIDNITIEESTGAPCPSKH
jgi:hypothetical protein